jgi:hypothetical protein
MSSRKPAPSKRWSELSEHEKDTLAGLLTLDGPEVVPRNRARWLEIAAEARASMKPAEPDPTPKESA